MSATFLNIDKIIRANIKHMCILQLVVDPAAGGGYIAALVDQAQPSDDPLFSAEGQTIAWALINLDTRCHEAMNIEASS